MRRRDPVVVSAGAAHLLAWVAALWLMVGPFYQGVSETIVTSGGSVSEVTRSTATLIEVNGLSVLPLLVAPVALTALVLMAVLTAWAGFAIRRVLLWFSVVVLLGLCAAGIFSIGLFYIPAATVLIIAAAMGSRRSLVSAR